MLTVPHYGIHWDDEGYAWLMQGRGSTNAFGLKKKPPFKVQLPSGGRHQHCNHMIPTSTPIPSDFQWNMFMQLIEDPLVKAALPLPKTMSGAYYVKDPSGDLMWYLSLLSRMSSPIYPCVVPRWVTNERAVVKELEKTNVQPFFVADLEPEDSLFMSKIGKAAINMPRKIILSGASDVIVPQTFTEIQTDLNNKSKYDPNDLEALHWEGLGATLVRKYMRREPYGKDAVKPSKGKA